jgi:glycosyltransferase involved in cell wall biosynthesis
MEKSLYIVGYFGYSNNKIDGQTIKTRNLFELLKMKKVGHISFFDSSLLKSNKLLIFNLIKGIISSTHIIYLPAHNNLKIFFPIIYILSKLFNKTLIYVVIGGWLPEFINNKPFHKWALARINGIFTETVNMKTKLELWYQYSNVHLMPNFRNHTYVPVIQKYDGKLRCVFMSRVIKEKGLDVIFRFIDRLNELNLTNTIQIDFYGPIPPNENEYVLGNIKKYAYLSYKGILDPEMIHQTLNNYDVMILPTRYPGEGFPGAILDAYISGIPVVVSNWKDIPSFVENGQTGNVFDLNNELEFGNNLIHLYNNKDLLYQMKLNSFEKSKEYSAEKCWEILNPFLK